jgi:pimeloyl-ACP methyl ester carboxylesterase
MTKRSSRRCRRLLRRPLRWVLGGLSAISLPAAAALAEGLFRTPPRQKRTRLEEKTLGEGLPLRIPSPSGTLSAWRWGVGGAPAVLLVHGWGGHAGRLFRFVAPLRDAGYSVVAFDALAHGASPGRRSSLPDFAEGIRAVEAREGPFEAVVGHSMGAAAAGLAIRDGWTVRRAVFLAPPADPEEFTVRFARSLRLPAGVRDAMKRRLAARYSTRWPDIKLIACAPTVPVPLLIFHDERDHKVPLRERDAILLAWRGATIVHTRGLGHHRILRDPEVIRGAVAFVAAGEASGRRAPRALPARDLAVPALPGPRARRTRDEERAVRRASAIP